MSTNEQTSVSQSTSAVRNTLRKEQVPQDLGRSTSNAALREYYDRNHHQLLPIIAEKEHQEKVHQDKLKAVKARLNFEEASQYLESGAPRRRRSLKQRLESRHAAACSEALSQGAAILSHQGKEVQKEEQCSKDYRKVYSTGLETRGRVRPRTQITQIIDHTIIVAKTLKAATRVLAQEKRSLFMKNVITKEHPYEGGKRYRKAKVAQEDIGSQGQRGKSRVLRTTCPNRGCVKKQILSLLGSRKRQIEEMLKAGKMSHLIKELKQSSGKDQAKAAKKVISFPPLREEDGTEGPMIIDAEMGGHFVHCIMDELHDRKVTISIQQNNREAMSKENPGSTVYNSRNAKIPSGRRNSYVTEQQDYSTRMHNGFRTRGTAIAEEKIQVANHPEYPEQTIAIGFALTEE
nr:hypothetical protein [Tanacetum cinerariifolium]GEY11956.1 hypothetical protein [Tanacetum cinerariifolium]